MTKIAVLAADATIEEISRFALQYPGCRVHGDLPTLGAIYRSARDAWGQDTLTDDLDQLCASLFYLQRAAHWTDHFDERDCRVIG